MEDDNYSGEPEEEELVLENESPTSTIDSFSLEELNTQLENALEQEDYEKASQLRDEINKRENN